MSTYSLTESWKYRLGFRPSGDFAAVREEPVGLIARASQGDGASIERLVELYQDTIYSIAMTFTRNPHRAEDLAQEAWIKVIRGLPKFKGGSRFSTWLYRITMNTFLNSTRKKQAILEGELESVPHPSESLQQVETTLSVHDAVRSLPAEFRAVVVLRYVADLSYKEIAQVLEVPLGTVQSRLKRGLSRLEPLLAEERNEGGSSRGT